MRPSSHGFKNAPSPTCSPVNAAVAHHDVRGPQTGAELRRHREQPDSRGAAGGVLTGGGAAAADKTLHQAVELLQRVEGPHQLDREPSAETQVGVYKHKDVI